MTDNLPENLPAKMRETMAQAPVMYEEWGMNTPQVVSTLLKSGLFGSAMTFEKAVAKVMVGKEMGMEPVDALRMIDIVEGQIGIRSEWRAKKIKDAGCDYRAIEHSATACTIAFLNEGKEEVGRHTFNIEDARAAGLAGRATWKNYPKTMLFWRCLSQGQRMYLPHVMGAVNVYDHDELEDVKRTRVVGTAETDEDVAASITAEILNTTIDEVQAKHEAVDAEVVDTTSGPDWTSPEEADSLFGGGDQ